MAQQQSVTESLDMSDSSATEGLTDPSLSRNASYSKLNAKAPEFVPDNSDGQQESHSQTQAQKIVMSVPTNGYGGDCHTHNQFFGGGGNVRGDDGEYHGQEEEVEVQQLPLEIPDQVATKNAEPSEEFIQKVVNQVEFYFSDLNLVTTDHLIRFINKDPEGYVPMSLVLSFKKIKTFTSNHSQLASVLRHSKKLVVSEDGKKLKRLHPFTETNLKELQSGIVVAENLPEDHCYQNLMRLFSAVGNVKNIRTCQPQPNNGGSSSISRSAKADSLHISNKLYAFVEYETVELAEKAVAELNNEGNWRSGLRVKFFPRHMSKNARAQQRKAHDGEAHKGEDVDHQPIDQALENTSSHDVLSHEQVEEESANDREGPKKGHRRGRGKGRGRIQPQHHNNRGNHQHIGAPNNHTSNDHPIVTKPPPGPRMPDGTKGFTMGRGKPIAVSCSPLTVSSVRQPQRF